MARKSRADYAEVSDIGDLPAVADALRRDSCRLDLHAFLTTYFPRSTGLKPFSDDHRRVIERIQTCILHGGRFVQAVYRGFAKSTISENAAIWAALYGHRKYILVLGADASSSDSAIDSIRTELEENDLLYEDFPEVCHAVRALEGKPQRQHSQHYHGDMTHIGWTADTVVLPTIKNSVASGVILRSRGITAAVRGLRFKRQDGTQQRPDFVIIDDPQTDESAASPLQVSKRMGILKKSVLKLGGHSSQLAVVVNATVIAKDDMIEQLLDPLRNPSFQGERIKMVRKWSDAHETLWMNEYAKLRNGYDPDDVADQQRAHDKATEFYLANRTAMDASCIVSWEHCYADGEHSAIQHAYNMLIDDGSDVFATECQQEPSDPLDAAGEQLQPKQVMARINRRARGEVPGSVAKITAFMDVQKRVLPWMVCAWDEDLTGYIIDYGCFPDQHRQFFTASDATRTLQKLLAEGDFDAVIYNGLDLLAKKLFVEWRRDNGSVSHIDRCLIDYSWGETTDIIFNFARQSEFAASIMPSKGVAPGPTERPLREWAVGPGERIGHHWIIKRGGKRATQSVMHDVNYWKSHVTSRLMLPMGNRGAISIFGDDPNMHQMLSQHLTAEYCIPTSAKGRTVNVWKMKPGQTENHWLDCLAGCAAAASIEGCCTPQTKTIVAGRRKVTIPDHLLRRGSP